MLHRQNYTKWSNFKKVIVKILRANKSTVGLSRLINKHILITGMVTYRASICANGVHLDTKVITYQLCEF